MIKNIDIKKGIKPKHITIEDDTQKEAHLTVHDHSHDIIVQKAYPESTVDGIIPESHDYFEESDSPKMIDYSQQKPTNIINSDVSGEITEEKYKENLSIADKAVVSSNVKESDINADLENMPFVKKKELLKKSEDAKKVVFMGTGSFAGEIINHLVLDPNFKIVMIITQPDKKIGRKKSTIHRTFAPNPVRDAATKNGIVLYQPLEVDHKAENKIQSMSPDILVVASYGRILPKYILDIPPMGAVNVHGSLLPLLRGASPIQNALMMGLKQTGITIMMMDAGMDTGDILAQETVTIEDHEKAEDVIKRVSIIGAQLLLKILMPYINKNIKPVPQDHSKATLCQLIDREDGHIQWTDTTLEIYNRYRALYPWPGIFSYWEVSKDEMLRIKLRSIYPFTNTLTEEEERFMPGSVFISRDQLCVKTFDTAIIVEAIQPECKAVMPIFDFLNGYKNFTGALLR